MYDRRTGQRCALCGWVWKPSGDVADDYPTKSTEASCGDIISNQFDGVSKAAVTKRNCTDDTQCSVTPSGLKQIGESAWMVVCTHHKDEN